MSFGRLMILLVILAISLAVGWSVWTRFLTRPRFSLRALFLGCTLVAIGLSAWISWDYWTTAQTTWLDPSSPEAASLTSDAVILEKDGLYVATFRPRFRNTADLFTILDKARLPNTSHLGIVHGRQEIELETSDRKPLEDRLSLLKTHDVLQPGWLVIRGRVVDSAGRPVGGATVDLMGPFVYVNHFQTRDDGSLSGRPRAAATTSAFAPTTTKTDGP